QDQRRYEVRQGRLPQYRPAFYAGEPESESGARRPAGQICAAEESDSGSDRSRLAAGAEAVVRADPGHDQAAPARGKYCRCERPTFARRLAGTRGGSIEDPAAGCPVSGRAAKIGRPLSTEKEMKSTCWSRPAICWAR